jgi:predicted nuclease of restriction endonuclease-like RecB superfamily
MHFSKYKAKKTTIDNIKFDSKAEANYYLYLKQKENLGIIEILETQPKVYLTDARILYKPDFLYLIRGVGKKVYVDVKGFSTPVFQIKKRLWKFYGPENLEIVKIKGKVFECEVVIPTKRNMNVMVL